MVQLQLVVALVLIAGSVAFLGGSALFPFVGNGVQLNLHTDGQEVGTVGERGDGDGHVFAFRFGSRVHRILLPYLGYNC